MTKEQAIALAETKFWERMTDREIAMFQLWEKKLCMPFGVFHQAVEKTLGRSVWTHEFAFSESLKKEMLGEAPHPSMEDIMNLIPAEKRIILVTP